MSQELWYTSVPTGLKPGSKGFCTVAMTAGLSAVVAQRLEMLSGYREIFPPGDPKANENPVAWSHWRLSVGGRTQSVLSRVCFAGMDYSHRANTFAHHLVLESSEQSTAGPAWTIAQPGVMETQWSGSPRLLETGRQIPPGNESPHICSAWAALAGDAGWAGVLAQTAANDSSRTAYLIYPSGADALALVREALAILPPMRRWDITFSTYFTELPAGLTCNWRCCVAGSQAAKESRRHATSGIVIDLTTSLGEAPVSEWVALARTGVPHTTTETKESDDESASAKPELILSRRKVSSAIAGTRSSTANPAGGPPYEIADNDDEDGDWQYVDNSSQPASGSISSFPAPDLVEAPLAASVTWSKVILWLVAIVWPLIPLAAAAVTYFKAKDETQSLRQTIVTKEQQLKNATVNSDEQDKRIGVLEGEKDDALKEKDNVQGKLSQAESDRDRFAQQAMDASGELRNVRTSKSDIEKTLGETQKQLNQTLADLGVARAAIPPTKDIPVEISNIFEKKSPSLKDTPATGIRLIYPSKPEDHGLRLNGPIQIQSLKDNEGGYSHIANITLRREGPFPILEFIATNEALFAKSKGALRRWLCSATAEILDGNQVIKKFRLAEPETVDVSVLSPKTEINGTDRDWKQLLWKLPQKQIGRWQLESMIDVPKLTFTLMTDLEFEPTQFTLSIDADGFHSDYAIALEKLKSGVEKQKDLHKKNDDDIKAREKQLADAQTALPVNEDNGGNSGRARQRGRVDANEDATQREETIKRINGELSQLREDLAQIQKQRQRIEASIGEMMSEKLKFPILELVYSKASETVVCRVNVKRN